MYEVGTCTFTLSTWASYCCRPWKYCGGHQVKPCFRGDGILVASKSDSVCFALLLTRGHKRVSGRVWTFTQISQRQIRLVLRGLQRQHALLSGLYHRDIFSFFLAANKQASGISQLEAATQFTVPGSVAAGPHGGGWEQEGRNGREVGVQAPHHH